MLRRGGRLPPALAWEDCFALVPRSSPAPPPPSHTHPTLQGGAPSAYADLGGGKGGKGKRLTWRNAFWAFFMLLGLAAVGGWSTGAGARAAGALGSCWMLCSVLRCRRCTGARCLASRPGRLRHGRRLASHHSRVCLRSTWGWAQAWARGAWPSPSSSPTARSPTFGPLWTTSSEWEEYSTVL